MIRFAIELRRLDNSRHVVAYQPSGLKPGLFRVYHRDVCLLSSEKVDEVVGWLSEGLDSDEIAELRARLEKIREVAEA